MSDKFDDVVTNWRLMIPIILTVTGLVIAIKFGIEYSLLTWDHITTEDAQIKATRVQVSAEVSGRLRTLYVTDGASVKTGDLLADLDPQFYQAEVDQVRALLEGMMHQLEAARHDLTLSAEQYRGELTQAQALLARRRSEVQEARPRWRLSGCGYGTSLLNGGRHFGLPGRVRPKAVRKSGRPSQNGSRHASSSAPGSWRLIGLRPLR